MERALGLAEPQGRVWIFLAVHGAAELLAAHPAHRTAHAAHLQPLLDHRRRRAGAAAPELAEPLSERELAVLRFLPTNLSAAEIGGELFLSVHTVKTHMRKLYAKLGVHTRAEAVERGRALGLLAPPRRGVTLHTHRAMTAHTGGRELARSDGPPARSPSGGPPVSSLLHRIAVFSARHRALVIGVWLVLLVGLGFASHAPGTKYSSSAEVAGSDSAAANDVMARSFSTELSDASPIVYHTEEGKLTDAENAAVVEESLKALSQAENVASVSDPLERYSQGRPDRLRDGAAVHGARRPVRRGGRGDPRRPPRARRGQRRAGRGRRPARHEDLQARGKTSELIGIAVAMLILVLVFGTVTAMVLPIAVAIFGLICGLSLVSLLGHVVAVPDVAPTVATMIGLGVGIDYSLFIVTRARSARHDGMSVHDAIGHAAATSGSAVAFAGGTVVIALLALAVSGVSLITVLGQASAIVVVVAVLASMTLLPALLGLCGDRIERLRVGRDKRPTLGHSALWERWGGRLARRPGLFAARLGRCCCSSLTAPVRELGLGLTDQSSAPQSTTVAPGLRPDHRRLRRRRQRPAARRPPTVDRPRTTRGSRSCTRALRNRRRRRPWARRRCPRTAPRR